MADQKDKKEVTAVASSSSGAAAATAATAAGAGGDLSADDRKRLDALKCTGAELMKWNRISAAELDWMCRQRSIDAVDADQLKRDYGETEYLAMLKAFAGGGKEYANVFSAVMWPGCGSRWADFHKFLVNNFTAKKLALPTTPRLALEAYANHLGRVVSYRSLSLTDAQYAVVTEKNAILPTGRLHPSQDKYTMREVINKFGVFTIARARLYIGRRMIGPYDPSLSLHDDAETSVCIAEGYMQLPDKRIRTWGVSIPKIEALGYAVMDVQDGKHRWFKHRSIWFDASLERCERYMLFEIAHLRQRTVSFVDYKSVDQVRQFLTPFANFMSAARAEAMKQDSKSVNGLSGDEGGGSDGEDEIDYTAIAAAAKPKQATAASAVAKK